MAGGLVLITAAVMVGFVVLVVGLLWLLRRFVSVWAAIVVGSVCVTYLVFSAVHMLWICNQPPTYIPPPPGDTGEGKMIFACDGPFGIIEHMYAYLLAPASAVVLGWIVMRDFRLVRRRRAATAGEGA